MRNICSLITIYNPNIKELKNNIEIMLQYSDIVYLLFNSHIVEELQFDARIISLDNKKNIGLSKAINKGIKRASCDGYEYALLFDQDSCLTNENFLNLKNEIDNENKNHDVACIGPLLNVRNNLIITPKWAKNNNWNVLTPTVCSVYNIITSGMLVNIDVFLQIGGFDEKYPVDFCDYLFCWKCIYNGYKVLQSKSAYMNHEVGINHIQIFNTIVHFHASYRHYFLVRDTLNVCLRNFETPFVIRCHLLFFLPFRMLLFLLLLDDKKTRLKMYWYGFKDFVLKHHGFGSIEKNLDAK
jgi:rhamnosyltransferase